MLDFPDSPTDGETSLQDNGIVYTWNTTLTRWDATPAAQYLEDRNQQVWGLLATASGEIVRKNLNGRQLSAVNAGVGVVNVTITPPFADDSYSIQSTVVAAGRGFTSVSAQLPGSFTVSLWDSAGSPWNSSVHLSIMGNPA